MFGDRDWPLGALRVFVSISWASCCIYGPEIGGQTDKIDKTDAQHYCVVGL